MASSWSVPRIELSCPVCQDIFQDPVLLPCSHSFCKVCVQRWWTTTRRRHCPLCMAVSSNRAPPCNRVLKNLCEAFLLEVQSGVVCRLHTERLKLYCVDHQTPICMVCRDSVHHINHRFAPVGEAAEAHRRELRARVSPLMEKVKLFNESKQKWEEADAEIQIQAQDTETKINEEFQVLEEFLVTEREVRIAALREEEERKRKMVKDKISDLTSEVNTLESTIKTIEGGLRDDDTLLLLKVNDLRKAAQRPLPGDPDQVTAASLDVAKHLGNVSFNVWNKMMPLVSYTPVILNPNTAHPDLQLSDGLTSVRCGPKQSPERTGQHRSVLGFEGFTSGSHSWDVEVGGNQVWALGVVAPDAQKDGDRLTGLWMVRFCTGKFTAFSPSCPVRVLPQRSWPRRVRVLLDWDGQKLSLLDADTNTTIHTFRHTFTNRLFPYVNTWSDVPLKMLPVNLSVALNSSSLR